MAWTAMTTRSTSDLITASIWNTDLTDNLTYLKTQTDLLNTVTMTNVFASRALDTLTYQATSKPRLVIAVILLNRSTDSVVYAHARVDSTSPAATTRATISSTAAGATAADQYLSLTVLVPPSYYYGISSQKINGTVTLDKWTEWDLH